MMNKGIGRGETGGRGLGVVLMKNKGIGGVNLDGEG